MSDALSLTKWRERISELEVLLEDAVSTGDVVSELTFSEMLSDAQEKFAQIEAQSHTKADAVILFEGSPVIGKEAIDASFAGAMLQNIQTALNSVSASLVTKGGVGARGPVSANANRPLYITDLAFGSFGFVLQEEVSDQSEAFETSEKDAVNELLDLLFAVSGSNEAFSETIESVDKRTFTAIKNVYEKLEKAHAQMKATMVGRELHLDAAKVASGYERLTNSHVDEDTMVFSAILLGLSPFDRKVDLRRLDTGDIVRGRAGARLSQDYLERIEAEGVTLGRVFEVEASIKTVRKPDGTEASSAVIRDLQEQRGIHVSNLKA